MSTYKNPEFFLVNGDSDVTVSVTFSADQDSRDDTLMRNAAEALTYFANHSEEIHKSWVKNIEVKK